MHETLLDLLPEHVAGPISELLEKGELRSVCLKVEQISTGIAVRGQAHEILVLEVSVGEETFRFFLAESTVIESKAETRGRLRSALQDWIAESGFAWGQYRN